MSSWNPESAIKDLSIGMTACELNHLGLLFEPVLGLMHLDSFAIFYICKSD